MPTYWTALTIGLIGVLITGIGNDSVNSKISFELFFSVIGVAEIARFFGCSTLYPGNTPLTTVGVEMLLYASYPFFIFLYRKFGLTALIGFGLICYSGVVVARLQGTPPLLIHGTYFEFVLYWIIGAVSASIYVSHTTSKTHSIWLKAITVAIITIYFTTTHLLKIKGLHVVTTPILAISTGLSLILLLRFEQNDKTPPVKIGAGLADLGERSYSLYVIHTPIILTSLYLLGHTNLPHAIYPWLTLLFTLIATEILYHLIERPCHNYARNLRL